MIAEGDKRSLLDGLGFQWSARYCGMDVCLVRIMGFVFEGVFLMMDF